jgi:hypothetical protein
MQMVEKNLEMELYLFQNMRITSITSELEVGYEVAKSEFIVVKKIVGGHGRFTFYK